MEGKQGRGLEGSVRVWRSRSASCHVWIGGRAACSGGGGSFGAYLGNSFVKVGLQGCTSEELPGALQNDLHTQARVRQLGGVGAGGGACGGQQRQRGQGYGWRRVGVQAQAVSGLGWAQGYQASRAGGAHARAQRTCARTLPKRKALTIIILDPNPAVEALFGRTSQCFWSLSGAILLHSPGQAGRSVAAPTAESACSASSSSSSTPLPPCSAPPPAHICRLWGA